MPLQTALHLCHKCAPTGKFTTVQNDANEGAFKGCIFCADLRSRPGNQGHVPLLRGKDFECKEFEML